MTTVTVAEDYPGYILVTVFVPFRESSRYVGQKAAGAARKFAGGKVSRISSGGASHGNGDWTYNYMYARG